jgi:hypothetical protein
MQPSRLFLIASAALSLLLFSACSDSATRDEPSGSGAGATGSGGDGGAGGEAGSGGATGSGGVGGGDKTLAAGQCHDDTECEELEYCGLEEDPLVCGTGAECGTPETPLCAEGWTCGPACDCGGAGCHQYCKAPCADVGCPSGQSCGVDGSCAQTTCSGTSDCPATFECMRGTCLRRACEHDAECGPGYCVGNACNDAPGVCGEQLA